MRIPHCDIDNTGIPSTSKSIRPSNKRGFLNPNEMKYLIYHEISKKSNAKQLLRKIHHGISRHIGHFPQMNGDPHIRPHRSDKQKDMKYFGVFQLKKTKNMVQYIRETRGAHPETPPDHFSGVVSFL